MSIARLAHPGPVGTGRTYANSLPPYPMWGICLWWATFPHEILPPTKRRFTSAEHGA
jgi:hypothetical protein